MTIFQETMNAAAETTLEMDAKVLATEAAIGTIGGVMEVFSRLIPKASDVISSLSGSVAAFLEKKEPEKLSWKKQTLLKKVQALPYISYREILIQVPEGFTGNLSSYLEWLKKVQIEVIGSANKLINDYSLELSMFLSNTDYRKTLKSHEKFFKDVRVLRSEVTLTMEKFFTSKSVASRVKLGSVMTRFAEFDDIIRFGEDLLTSADFKKELAQMLASVNHASELLSLLKDKLEKRELDGVSADMAKHIAEGAFECGKYVELISILVYHSENAVACVNGLATQLDELTK